MVVSHSCWSCAGLQIWHFYSQILKFRQFLMHLAFFENQKYQSKSCFFFFYIFQSERLGSGTTLSEVHIHYKSLLTGLYDHAGCKEYCKDFTLALQIFDVFNKKQMYDSVFPGKGNASKYWSCISSILLLNFKIYLCLVSSVQFIYASRPSAEYFIRNTGTGSDGRSCHLRHWSGFVEQCCSCVQWRSYICAKFW